MVKISRIFSIEHELYARFKDYCQDHDKVMSHVLSDLVEKYMDEVALQWSK